MISYRQADYDDFLAKEKAGPMYDELVISNNIPKVVLYYNPIDQTLSLYMTAGGDWGLPVQLVADTIGSMEDTWNSSLDSLDTKSGEDMKQKVESFAETFKSMTTIPVDLDYKINYRKAANVDDRVTVTITFLRPR